MGVVDDGSSDVLEPSLILLLLSSEALLSREVWLV